MPSNQLKNQHLMWRAGFGPAISQLEELKTITPKQLYQSLKKTSEGKAPYIDVADEFLKTLLKSADAKGEEMKRKDLDPEDRKMLREKSKDNIKSLNLTWLFQMVESRAQLREKMALFWHGHFATRDINIFYQQQLLDIVRQNALDSFRDLLHQVSKSASMMNFLNAQQNKKDHPNENFAREVMELFTLGRGNYTENDIKEAARAFTGWGSTFKGTFQFRRFQHDDGSKTVLGKTGNFNGEDVLNVLLEQKQTARFITQKIYRYFVNEAVDKDKVEWLTDRFYKSDYNIGALMEDIFTSDWFYDTRNIGARIKSPIELMVGIQRMIPMKLENEEALLLLQRVLGQVLFYPPNVAGWPGGKSWIDSSTLMVRMRIPRTINDQDDLNIKPKTDDDVAGGKMEGKGKQIKVTIDWSSYMKAYESTAKEQLFTALSSVLLQMPMKVPAESIKSFMDNSSRETYIKSATQQLMSLPEYQMC